MTIRPIDLKHGAYLWAMTIWIIFSVTACSDNSTSNDGSSDRHTSITFQLEFEQSANLKQGQPNFHTVGKPDICNDYQIDTISVQIFRAADDFEIATVQEDCAAHSLSVDRIPARKNLYVICKGKSGSLTNWQGRLDEIVAVGGQTTDIGTITMKYLGDDDIVPEVVSTFPAADAADIDLKASIAVVFSEALAPGSISDQAITVTANNESLTGSLRYEPGMQAIIFSPAEDTGFDAQTTYTATLHAQSDDNGRITDIAGNSLAADRTWQFGTRGTQDTNAPQVIATSPANGATGFGQQSTVSAVFSEPMDPDTLTGGVFQLSSDQGAVDGQIGYDAQTRTLTLTPDSDLAALTLYTAMISTGAADLAQNALAAPHTWQFTTSGPKQTLTISKTGSGTGRVVSTPSYIDCGATCQAEVNIGTMVSLNAVADNSSEFAGWSGDYCSGETGTCTLTITDQTTITANFRLRKYNISASVTPDNGDGGTFSPSSATVNHGDAQTFTVQVKPYYSVSELIVDGNPVTPHTSYRFENITANHTIHAVLKNNAVNISNNPVHADVQHQINANGDIVWAGYNFADRAIYYHDGSGKTNISKDPATNDSRPQINANGDVVWLSISGSDTEVYFYDGISGANISNNPNSDDYWAQLNSDGDVVWESGTAPETAIFYYDRSSNTSKPISENPDGNPTGGDYRPQINADGHVVWYGIKNSEKDVFYYDGSGVKIISEAPDHLPGNHTVPKINDSGYVVWQGGVSFNYNIYYYNKIAAKIISDNSYDTLKSHQINTAGHAVWSCSDGQNTAIYYDDGQTLNTITATLDSGQTHGAANLNEDGRVVWWSNTNPGYAIYYYDHATKTVARIAHEPDVVIETNNTNISPKISDNGVITWAGYDGQDWEIFRCEP